MKRALSILFGIICIGQVSIHAQLTPHIPAPKPFYDWKDTVTVTIIGDVMMHSKQLSYTHDSFLEHITYLLKDSDFAIANMEFSLGGEPYTGYPSFSTPDSFADYVADCGVDVFLTANNHILDRGHKGLERTLGVYRSMAGRIDFAGSAANEEEMADKFPLIISARGLKIALLNFTYGTNFGKPRTWPRPAYMDQNEILAAIGRARDKGADYIIALPHWGHEYKLQHSPEQESWAEWLVNNGVDAIVGSHPHVVQDSCHIKGKAVIYSIGNAVSNMSAINTRIELAVRLRFTVSGWDGKTEMLEPELIPMWCSLPGMLRDNYSTIIIKDWATRRSEWLNPNDYDNMMSSLKRVSELTGIEFYSEAALL